MSMNKEAIEHIQESANIPRLADQLVNAETQTPIALIPKSFVIADLEKFMPNASRYRLHYNTTSIDSFIKYCKKFAYPGATCFIEADTMHARCVFDLGTIEEPGHQENRAALTLKKMAAFKAISDIDGQVLTQKEAAEFIEDWETHITALNKDNDGMGARTAASALRDLTIESAKEINSKVGDFGEAMSSMERIDAKNQENLPAALEFECEPYRGLDTAFFTLRVSLLTGEDRPRIVFRISKLEHIQEQLAEEFKGILAAGFESTDIETFIGDY